MRIVEHTLPIYWASYLVNGDASGLEPEEKEVVDVWMAKTRPGWCLNVSEHSWFQHGHDANRNQGADVCTYYFDKPPVTRDMRRTITRLRAMEICSYWHGGQWSALYQYGSSGVYLPANALRYLREVEDSLHPEYALHPGELTRAQERELTSLKRFFIKEGRPHGYTFEFHKHEIYGYLIPFLNPDVPESLAKIVEPLKYMK